MLGFVQQISMLKQINVSASQFISCLNGFAVCYKLLNGFCGDIEGPCCVTKDILLVVTFRR